MAEQAKKPIQATFDGTLDPNKKYKLVEVVPSINELLADAAASRDSHPNETISGGRYLYRYPDGQEVLVNCWNQRIDETGKVLDEQPLPRE